MKATRRILTVVLGVLAAAAVCSAQESLFLDHAGVPETAILSRVGVDRSRPVDIDLGTLEDGSDPANPDPEGRVVLLNLFDDVQLLARVARVERWEGGSTWAGRLEGQAAGDVVLTVDDRVVSGRVESAGATYSVRWDGKSHVVEETRSGGRTAGMGGGERPIAEEPETPAATDGPDGPEPAVERADISERAVEAGNDEGLLRDRLRSTGDDTELDFGVVRSRPIDVALGHLPGVDGRSLRRSGEQTLRLNLFDDVDVVARLGRPERLEKGMAWTGRLEGEPLSDVTLVLHDGVLAGSIVGPSGTYSIRWDGAGYVVEEIDHSLFPEVHDCALEVPAGLVQADPPLAAPDAQADDGSIVDVFVGYTPAARAAEGGTTAMEARIDLAILETNQAYQSSGVIQRLRLVGTAEVSYTEADISTDLGRVANPSDGIMDEVHGLRDSAKADLFSLIGGGYGACGIAYVMTGSNPGFAPYAFSVVDRTCMTGYYSFGHELGHNMGLNHDRAQYAGGVTSAGAYSYSYGYQDPAAAFRTVMAYNCPGGCTRVKYFSNPEVLYGGDPMGIAVTESNSAHNALSLNQTRVTVANWRHSGPTAADLIVRTPNGGESWAAGTQQILSWSSTSLSATEIQVHLTDGVDTVLLGSVPSDWGGASWYPPPWAGSDWRIKLCAVNEDTPAHRSRDGASERTCEAMDASDAPFTITTP